MIAQHICCELYQINNCFMLEWLCFIIKLEFLKILHFVLRSQMLISSARNKGVIGEPEEISNFCKTMFCPTSLFYKKVVYKKVVLDSQKP